MCHRIVKGPVLIRCYFGLRFSENLKFLNSSILHSHNKGNMSYYQDYVQTSVCMFTVAMETPIICFVHLIGNNIKFTNKILWKIQKTLSFSGRKVTIIFSQCSVCNQRHTCTMEVYRQSGSV